MRILPLFNIRILINAKNCPRLSITIIGNLVFGTLTNGYHFLGPRIKCEKISYSCAIYINRSVVRDPVRLLVLRKHDILRPVPLLSLIFTFRNLYIAFYA